jgi:hypothetical protein
VEFTLAEEQEALVELARKVAQKNSPLRRLKG